MFPDYFQQVSRQLIIVVKHSCHVTRRWCEQFMFSFLSAWCDSFIRLMFLVFQETSDYKYFGTFLDTRESLNQATEGKLLNVCVSAAQMAGQMALRLVHDHILNLDVSEYNKVIMNNVLKITKEIRNVRFVFVCCLFFSWWMIMMRCRSRFSQELCYLVFPGWSTRCEFVLSPERQVAVFCGRLVLSRRFCSEQR